MAARHVVSLSLGSSARNHRVTVELLGQQVVVERIGTDGNLQRVIEQIQQLDGTVDAFGMGGIDRYIYVQNRRYTFRDAELIARHARKTPILDGSGLKNTLERHVVQRLADDPRIALRGKKVLLVSGLDRFGMAEALVELGCEVTFGDLMFGMGVPVPIASLKSLDRISRVVAPLVTRLPFRYLYPTGEKQREIAPKFEEHYKAAEVIAGDFHYIRRHLPQELPGKVIVTNTVTQEDVELLRARGVRALVTTTPHLEGRSFGTNVMEALIVALADRKGELQPEEYLQVLDAIGFAPHVQAF